MELCGERVGRGKNKCLYLYGSSDNGHYLCADLTRKADFTGRNRDSTYFDMVVPVRIQDGQEENKNKDTASPAMITFLVLNTAGVTLIPTTTIALRMAHGSLNPSCIILPSIIATTISSVCGLTLDYLIRRKNKG